jgi:hypothetical protein
MIKFLLKNLWHPWQLLAHCSMCFELKKVEKLCPKLYLGRSTPHSHISLKWKHALSRKKVLSDTQV